MNESNPYLNAVGGGLLSFQRAAEAGYRRERAMMEQMAHAQMQMGQVAGLTPQQAYNRMVGGGVPQQAEAEAYNPVLLLL